MSFGAALEELREADELPTKAKPPTETDGRLFLDLTEIIRIEVAFQPRTFVENDYEYEQHLRALTEALKRKPRGSQWLDPVLVKEIDQHWVCIDGHHRLDAYAEANIDRVQVEIFEGTVNEAVVLAGEENNKAKRNLSPKDRLEYAWRLTAAEIGSKREVVTRSGTSDGTVSRMRRIRRKLEELGRKPDRFTYPQAQDVLEPKDNPMDEQEWKTKAIAKLSNTLRRTFGKSAHKNRGLLAEALQETYPSVVQTIIEDYALEHRETIEYLFKEHDHMS